MAGSGGIFISYRRDDTAAATGRLADLVVARFGRPRVFLDVDTFEPGEEFAGGIDRAVRSCDVLLAPIGPNWLSATDRVGRRRIDQPDDFVALEIGTALRRDVRVIPILVDGARMVEADDLPDHLRGLASRHAVPLDDASFQADASRILDAVDKVLTTEELRRDAGSWRRPGTGTDDGPARHLRGEDSDEAVAALLIARSRRRTRAWWWVFGLSLLLAFSVRGVLYPTRPVTTVDAAMAVVVGVGLVWAVLRLRREILRQRALVDQLPVARDIEPIRRAVSWPRILALAVVCLALSTCGGLGAPASSPSPRGPAGTTTAPPSTQSVPR